MTAHSIFDWLQKLDRRFIYSFIFVAVTVPFYTGWPPTKIEVSREVEDLYQTIEAIPPNSNPLLLSFDYDPASEAELTPMAEAALRHCFSRDIRVLVISLQYTGQGAGIAAEVVPRIAAEFDKEQNVDWAFLGFQPQATMAMLQLGESIPRTYPTDYYGTPVEEIPLMESIQNYEQIPAVLTLASTAIGEFWPIFAGSRYGVTCLAGVTAVYVADIQPFYQTEQIKGVLGGLKGAAEYEKRIDYIADGTAGMSSQKMVHFVIVGFIIMGNIAYLLSRRRKA
jgi:hypothetical protein